MSEHLWDKFLEAWPALTVTLITWIALQVQRVLVQVRLLNGRITKLENQQVGHDTLDDARFGALQRELELIEPRTRRV